MVGLCETSSEEHDNWLMRSMDDPLPERSPFSICEQALSVSDLGSGYVSLSGSEGRQLFCGSDDITGFLPCVIRIIRWYRMC